MGSQQARLDFACIHKQSLKPRFNALVEFSTQVKFKTPNSVGNPINAVYHYRKDALGLAELIVLCNSLSNLP